MVRFCVLGVGLRWTRLFLWAVLTDVESVFQGTGCHSFANALALLVEVYGASIMYECAGAHSHTLTFCEYHLHIAQDYHSAVVLEAFAFLSR